MDTPSISLPCLLNHVLTWPWQQPQVKHGVKRNLQPGGGYRTGDSESIEVHNATNFLQRGFTINKELLFARATISILKISFIFGVSCTYCLLQALTIKTCTARALISFSQTKILYSVSLTSSAQSMLLYVSKVHLQIITCENKNYFSYPSKTKVQYL